MMLNEKMEKLLISCQLFFSFAVSLLALIVFLKILGCDYVFLFSREVTALCGILDQAFALDFEHSILHKFF